MATFNFSFEELQNSPQETIDTEKGFMAVRRFRVPWDNRYDFGLGLLGDPSSVTTVGRDQYPDHANVRVVNVEIEPFLPNPAQQTIDDTAVGLNIHQHALITVRYETYEPNFEKPNQKGRPRDDRIPSGILVEYEARFSGEYMTHHGRMMTWEDNSEQVPPDAHPSILIPITEHLITLHHVPAPNWGAMRLLSGQVNDAAFRMPITGFVFPAETLLFEGAVARRQWGFGAAAGNKVQLAPGWKVQYAFKEKSIIVGVGPGANNIADTDYEMSYGQLSSSAIREHRASRPSANNLGGETYGWNHALRENPPGWAKPLIDYGSFGKRFMYQKGDFNALYQFN